MGFYFLLTFPMILAIGVYLILIRKTLIVRLEEVYRDKDAVNLYIFVVGGIWIFIILSLCGLIWSWLLT